MTIRLGFALVCLVIFSCAVPKKGGEMNVHKVDGVNNVAVKGYDVVSYFQQQRLGKRKPIKGTKDLSYQFQDVNWFFSSQQNLDAFKSNPLYYAPQYGGYCAYGVSVPQQKIDIEPEEWTVYNGKLYLNYTKRTQDIWLDNKDDHIEAANDNWPEVKLQ